MSGWIEINRDEKHIKREREKARELRHTSWWKSLISQGTCHYCHDRFLKEDLSMDHIVPVVRGGKSTKGNVVVSCKNCNNKKKYLTPAEIILEELEKENKLN